MTNKIVILDNSVELYEHYIDDQKWERTLAFPRGGVTYLVSNKTIKFYAYEDYLYRNCIISMQLPIHVVDEFEHIDGEYEDIDELAEVLDRIFPTNDLDAELAEYLRIKDAELTYQPIGDYALKSEIPDVSHFVTDEDLVDALDDYYTKDEADDKFQEKGEYYTKDEADVRFQPIGEYYTKNEADGRFQPIGDYVDENTFTAYTADTAADIDELDNKKADVSALTPYFDDAAYDTTRKEIVFYNNGVEKDSIDARPFIKDGMVSDVKIVGDNLVITFNTDSGKEPISIPLSSIFNPSNYYTKNESDGRFQPKGDYVSADTFTAYTAQTDAELDDKADKDDVYTKAQTDDRFQGKLIAGDNITITSGNVISAAGGEMIDAYTKEESDELFQRRGDYITKTELDNILDDYTTKQWVLSKNYVTQSTLNTYITNLQEQINSLQEALDTCCSYHPSGETIYRWLTLTGPNDYLCSGTTKYEKQIYQQSTDNGITWTNVVPEQSRRGSVIEYSSVDCGADPPITDRRWVNVPNEYMCKTDASNDHCKYEVMKLQYSYDSGATWVDSNPLQTANGTLIECQSYDCGYDGCKYSCEAKLSGDSTVYHPATWVGYSNGVLNDYTTHQGWLSTHNSTLTYLKFNECVTSVASNAFYIKGYSAIEYMDIPSTVVSIGHSAFNIGTSTKFKTMVVRSVFPPQLSEYEDNLDKHGTEGPTFKSYNRNFKIYVPDESLETYKNTPRWSNYRDILYPISQLL